MNKYDVSGIMQTYAEKARKAANKEQLKKIIRDLKEALKNELPLQESNI